MPINEARFVSKVYDVINTAVNVGTGAANSFFTMEYPATPLDARAYANPWSPINPSGSTLALENFAWLVDSAPGISQIYQPRNLSVDQLYGQIVNGAVPTSDFRSNERASVDLSQAERVLFVRENDFFRDGSAVSVRVPSPQLIAFQNARQQRDLYAMRASIQQWQDRQAERQSGTETRAIVRQAEPAPASLDSRTEHREVIEAAASWDNSDYGGIARVFSEARRTYSVLARGSVILPGMQWHMTFASPENWFSNDDNFLSVTVSENESAGGTNLGEKVTMPRKPTLRIPPGFRPDSHKEILIELDHRKIPSESLAGATDASRPVELWNNFDLGLHTYQSYKLDDATSNLRVSFKFARVRLGRPWLDMSVFSLGGWRIPGRRRAEISTGTLISNDSLLPTLPVEMIVARDLRITASWGMRDVERLQQLAEGFGESANWSLGPFRLSGAYATGITNRTHNARTDGISIDCPGLQVLGWVCRVVPLSPPES